METALVSVSTGVMDRLLSKLSMLLEKYYHKLRGVSKQIKLLRDEMSVMRPALLMLADEEQLNPLTKEWRDELRELAYDAEDCVDDFMTRVDHEEEGPAGILGILSRFKKSLNALTTRHEIANKVEELKARAIEASKGYKRYNFIQPASTNPSTFAIDPRLPALYEDIDRLVGIDGPKKHIIERLFNGSSDELKVVSIVGCGGLGKTTLANQVYHTIKDSITKLPEKIEELQHLQTLDVRETGIRELPPSITRLQRLTHLYVSSRTTFPEGVIGQMQSLEELGEYAVSFKHGNSFQELSMLTKLKTLRIGFSIGSNYMPEFSQRIPIHDVGTLLSSSRSLHNLSISGAFGLPLSLNSWNPPAAPCSLRELCLEHTLIYAVPSWMGTFGNLGVLKLEILIVWPDDVEILGAIPGLVFLGLATTLGSDGNIIVRGSDGFRNLKHFHLGIYACGSHLEFEAGSMPKLEHMVYEFPMHKMECMVGVCRLGLQNLPALSKVEVRIDVHFRHGRLYDPAEATEGSVLWVEYVLEDAVEALPNRPAITVQTGPGPMGSVHQRDEEPLRM
ncbi:hypothetical protein EJB05_09475, partial [Eragrostis curvula]